MKASLATRSCWLLGWTLGQVVTLLIGGTISIIGYIVWFVLTVYFIAGVLEHFKKKSESLPPTKPVQIVTQEDRELALKLYKAGGAGVFVGTEGSFIDVAEIGREAESDALRIDKYGQATTRQNRTVRQLGNIYVGLVDGVVKYQTDDVHSAAEWQYNNELDVHL